MSLMFYPLYFPFCFPNGKLVQSPAVGTQELDPDTPLGIYLKPFERPVSALHFKEEVTADSTVSLCI